jgi:hypothetical protein
MLIEDQLSKDLYIQPFEFDMPMEKSFKYQTNLIILKTKDLHLFDIT